MQHPKNEGLSLPQPRETFAIAARDGAQFYIRVHGPRGAPRLILSHGNGFAVDAYLPFWRHLLPHFELVLFDFRNHGANPYHGPQGHDWATFVEDFELVGAAIRERLGAQPTAGVFHSLSAITSLLHAVKFGWQWQALVLFEPPLQPPSGHPLHREALEGEARVAEWARQRRERFESPEELTREWKTKRSFRRWVDGAHGLMARSILVHDARSGEWRLNCPRELEAKIYVENLHPELWVQLPALPGPVLIIGSDVTPASPVAARAARAAAMEAGLDYAAIPDTTHLLMIEEPEACAAAACDFLQRNGFLRA